MINSIDKYHYPDEGELRSNKFREFLWFCAGADLQLLRHCPQSERIKEEGIGGVVLATAVLAFLSSSYAFYIVFHPASKEGTDPVSLALSIFMGLIWSLIIFNLDRFIVSSSGHGDGTEKITLDEFLGAIPRLLMALIIGFTLSKPLEIRVMQSELNAILVQEQNDFKFGKRDAKGNQITIGEYEKEENRYKQDQASTRENERFKQLIADKTKLEEDIKKYQADEDKYGEDAAKESQGIGGSGKYGDGPGLQNLRKNEAAARAKKETATTDLAKFVEDNKAVLEEYKKELDVKKKTHEAEIAKIDDLSAKMGGLVNRITWGHEHFPAISWALTLLLLSIEVAPILYKLMIRNGPYHYLTENQREIVAARYAVERKANALAGVNGQQVEIEIYHQAEVALKSSLAHLNSEARLSQKALDNFEKTVAEDIDKNPDKYIKSNNPQA